MPSLRLRAIDGAQQGREYSFPGPRVRIGRSRDNDLILADAAPSTASGRHAEARLDAAGAWWIVDAGSSNGTRVNGVAASSSPLKTGDRLTFGDQQFVVSIDRPAARWRRVLVAVGLIFGAVAAGYAVSRWMARPAFATAADGVVPAVFLIALEEGGERRLVGTGFVAAAGMFATSAHIADALIERDAFGSRTRRAIAIGRGGSPVVQIASTKIHPAWRRGSLQGDVAVLHTPGIALPAPVRLAPWGRSFRQGTLLATFGFPAVTTDVTRPAGRLSVDVLAAVRSDFLEIGLGIAPGVSGSPVFDEAGEVVGIVAGGDFVAGPKGLPVPSGSSANWAIRIDALRPLLTTQ